MVAERRRGCDRHVGGATFTWAATGAQEPGINLEDDLEWIRRDQYVYYVEMAHALGDPTDWASFRADLAEALAAAFGLYRTPPLADSPSGDDLSIHRRTLDVLESIRFRHDPSSEWRAFSDALWRRRSELRIDL